MKREERGREGKNSQLGRSERMSLNEEREGWAEREGWRSLRKRGKSKRRKRVDSSNRRKLVMGRMKL